MRHASLHIQVKRLNPETWVDRLGVDLLQREYMVSCGGQVQLISNPASHSPVRNC